MSRFRAGVRQAASIVDLHDVFAFGGLGLVFAGVWQMHQPAALIVVGVALFWLGVRR